MAARSRSEKRLDAAYNEPQGRSLIQRKHTILRLGRYMIQYKWLLLLAFVMTVGSNLLALVGPMLSGFFEGFSLRRVDGGVLCDFFGVVLRAFCSDDHHQPKGGLPDEEGCIR